MRAIEITQPGGPEVLKITERPKPVPKDFEVLIEVHAAGINRPDCFQRQGAYPPPPGVTDIPGLEVAGTVVGKGAQVQSLQIGDSICALVAGGGYAEFVCAPEGQCLPIPYDLDMIQAAALPETFFTVWTNLYESGRLQENETVLIHGGAGGIGTTAIQMAANLGSRVFTTVGKKESVEICQKLGAERVILYKEEDFVKVVQEQTEGRGVDVILDMVGGDYFARNLEALAMKGRLVQIATLQGAKVEVDLRKVMAKQIVITGSTLRPRSVEEKTRIAKSLQDKVWPLVSKGRMRPVIYSVLPLEQASKAHASMEQSQHTGKIVLKVKDL